MRSRQSLSSPSSAANVNQFLTSYKNYTLAQSHDIFLSNTPAIGVVGET